MRRLLIMVTVLLLVTSTIVGCGQEADLQAAEVSLDSVSPIASGKQNVTLLASFNVSNPNPYEVTLDQLEYFIQADESKIGAGQLSDLSVYIPANSEVIVNATFTVPLSNVVAEFVLGGLPPEQAIVAAMPVWKNLGGALPMDALQPVWDASPQEDPTYMAQGSIRLFSPTGKKLESSYSSTR